MVMKIALVQHDIAWANQEANFSTLAPLIREAATNGAQLVVLTEMFSTGFVVDQQDIGEPEGGASSQFLVRMATENNIHVCGTCPETTEDDIRPYNSFVIASPQGTTHRYRKIHPFTYGGEDKHFRPGDQHVTLTIDEVTVSLFVCYDLRFADEFWALAHQTDLYLVPANWPSTRREHWTTLLRARAMENQAYVAGCNRVGSGGNLEYSGDSCVIGPFGDIVAAAGADATILYADIDPHHVKSIRARYPFLQDRR